MRSPLVAVLDACVLFPAPIRDLLLHIAAKDAFQPKWSAIIHDEWKRNLLLRRPDLKAAQLERTVKEMNRAFPDAMVSGFEDVRISQKLPDPGDLHVVAAAIHGRASQIVTFNLKDFPKAALKPHGLAAIHPDEFILERIAMDPQKIIAAFKNQVQSLKNPPKTYQQVILTLENCGLKKVGEWLQTAITRV